MRYEFRLEGRTHHVTLEEHAEGPRFLVDGTEFTPEVEPLGKGRYRVAVDGGEHEFLIENGIVHEGHEALDLEVRRTKPELVRTGAGGRRADGKVKPPMPGKVVEVHVKEGDAIEEGAPLLVLEAMKMQNDLKSPVTGVVAKVLVKPGSNVEATTVMVEIEPETSE